MVVCLLASIAPGRSSLAQSVTTWHMGVNLSALEDGHDLPGTANTDYALPTDAEFDFLRRKNLTFVRLPFKWERLQPILSGPLDATYLGYIQAAVAKAAARGMEVALDCHNFGGYGAAKIGGGIVTDADFADLWSRLAAVFKTNPAVAAYDIMNEPSNMPGPDAWQRAAQAAINAIRAVDTRTPIFVEGNNYASAFTWARTNPTLHLLHDPANRLVFSAHAYLDRDNSGTHFAWKEEVAAGDRLTGLPLDAGIGVRRVAGFVNWLELHGLKGNIGETGAGSDDPSWLSALDREIEFLLANKVTFIYWDLGPFFHSYPYSIEPDDKDMDKVQVAVLTKYTGAAQPATYTVTEAASDAVGKHVSNFTISYRGLIKAPVIFTPSDSGGGGTFVPPAVTMLAGFNGIAKFRYIPPGRARIAISTKNNAGFIDPPAIQIQGSGCADC